MSTIPTAMKRNRVQDYNGPKAVRDHGRVATREKNSAAGDESPQEQSCHIDSGFDLPDSRAADATPSRPKVHITATLAGGLIVSSGEAEITP